MVSTGVARKYQIGVLDPGRGVRRSRNRRSQFQSGIQIGAASGRCDDLPDHPGPLERQGEGAADEADADHGKSFNQRLLHLRKTM